jgi:hypothetical protein
MQISLQRWPTTPIACCSETSGSGRTLAERPEPHHCGDAGRGLPDERVAVAPEEALDNGVTREELIELITHLAFYSGWPTANSAVTIARRVFDEGAV